MGYSNVQGDLNVQSTMTSQNVYVFGSTNLNTLTTADGVTINGSLSVPGTSTFGKITTANLTVTGNFTVTTTNTAFSNALSVNNAGTATALKVVQFEGGGGGHTFNVAEFWDYTQMAMVIDPEGNVGIHTTNTGSFALSVADGANVDSLQALTVSTGTLSTPLANVTTLNVGTLANINLLNVSSEFDTVLAQVTQLYGSQINSTSANILTANLLSANITTGNVSTLNVSTRANVTYLTVSSQLNSVSTNVLTANILSANITTGNVSTLNIWTGANITYMTVSTQMNSVSSNILTANVLTGNVSTLGVLTQNVSTLNVITSNTLTGNVSTLTALGANVTTLSAFTSNTLTGNVSTFTALVANVSTLNVSTSNSATANVSTLTALSANVTTFNTFSSNVQTGNISTFTSLDANVTTLNAFQSNTLTGNVSTLTALSANVTTFNTFSSNVQTGNISTFTSLTANVTTLNAFQSNTLTGNVSTLTALAANVTTLNAFTSNTLTGNVSTLTAISANVTTLNAFTSNTLTENVSTLTALSANVTTLNAFTSNTLTGNVSTLTAISANVTTLNAFTSNTLTGNFSSLSSLTSNINSLNVGSSANVTNMTVTNFMNVATANIGNIVISSTVSSTTNSLTANSVTVVATNNVYAANAIQTTNIIASSLYGPIVGSNTVSATVVTASSNVNAPTINATTANAMTLVSTAIYGPVAGQNTISATVVTAYSNVNAPTINATTANAVTLVSTAIYGPVEGQNTISATVITASSNVNSPVINATTANAVTLVSASIYGPIAGSNTVSATVITASSNVNAPTINATTANAVTLVSAGIYGPIVGSNVIGASVVTASSNVNAPTINATTANAASFITTNNVYAANAIQTTNIVSTSLTSNSTNTNITSTLNISSLLVGGSTAGANQTLITTGSGAGVQWGTIIGSQWTTGTGNIYYISNVGIGTSAVSANLSVTGNIYASNSIQTTNIVSTSLTSNSTNTNITSTLNISSLLVGGSTAGANQTLITTGSGAGVQWGTIIGSQWTTGTGNIYYISNVGIGTSAVSANLSVTGNIYASNSIQTTNIVSSGFTSNSTNIVFNFDTINIPYVEATSGIYGSIIGANTISASSLTLTSALGLTYGGTGQTTKAAAFDALSPMTTLGDMIYGGASGANARLPGNTTATKNFLVQTGNGTVSGAPSWGTLGASDLPTVTFSPGAAGTYGSSSAIPTIVVDAYGRITGISTSAAASLSGLTTGGVLYATSATAATSGSSLYWDSANSRLGIGTNSPGCALSFGATTNNKILCLWDGNSSDSVSTGYSFYGFGVNSNYLRFQVPGSGTTPSDGFYWYSANTERMRIQASTGYVGIGTNNPSKLLHVWGGMIIGASTDSRATTVTLNAPGTTVTFSPNADIGDGARIMTLQCPDLSSTTANLVSFSLQVAPTGTFGSQRTSIDLKGFRVASQSYGGFCITSPFDTAGSYDLFYTDRSKAYFQQSVGIGTNNPQTTLDVNGSMNAQNFAQPTFTNQQYTSITTASSMAGTNLGAAGGITISKTASGTTSWDACAYSNQSYKYGAYCSARAAQTNQYVMFGLSTNQTSGLGTGAYTSISYAWYFVADTTLQIYENGTNIGTFGNYNVTTSASITFDGSNIIYWKDGVAVRTVARSVGSPLYFMCTPYNSGGSKIYDVVFGPRVDTNNAGQVITASTGFFSNTIYACKTGAVHNGAETPGLHAVMAVAPDGTSGNASIWMGFDPTNDCGYINSARSGQIRPICIQTRGGNVGIGTTNPGRRLHVYDTATSGSGPFVVDQFGASGFTDTVTLFRGAQAASSSWGVCYMQSSSGGNNLFYVRGDGYVWAANDITAFSDARVKTNVTKIDNALDKVSRINGYTFNRSDCTDEIDKQRRHAGVIAQEIQEVLPEVVTEDKNGLLSVAYGNLTALLIEALKDERKAREALEERIKFLEQR